MTENESIQFTSSRSRFLSSANQRSINWVGKSKKKVKLVKLSGTVKLVSSSISNLVCSMYSTSTSPWSPQGQVYKVFPIFSKETDVCTMNKKNKKIWYASGMPNWRIYTTTDVIASLEGRSLHMPITQLFPPLLTANDVKIFWQAILACSRFIAPLWGTKLMMTQNEYQRAPLLEALSRSGLRCMFRPH